MLRRLVSIAALAALTLSVPAFAASGNSSTKPAAKSSSTKKKAPAKKTTRKAKPAAVATPTPAPVAATPASLHKANPEGRTFIRTQRAGWQEVIVGNEVIAKRADGSQVTGTIREVSDYAIVIEPKTTQQVMIAASDLNEVFAAR